LRQIKTKIFLQKGLDRRFGDLPVAGFVIWITRWSMSYFEQAAGSFADVRFGALRTQVGQRAESEKCQELTSPPDFF